MSLSLTSNSLATSDQLKNHAVLRHEHGVLHNDLEPRGVVISGGKLKIIDFGMVELGNDCSRANHCISLLELQNSDIMG